MGLIQLESNY